MPILKENKMSSICFTVFNEKSCTKRRFQKSSLLTFQSKRELKMKCKKFCEGNSLLEKVLYELNVRDLNTFACCKGHSNKNGYISFKVSKESSLLANELCTSVLRRYPVSIHIHENRALFRGLSVSIFFSMKSRNEILKFLLDRIKHPKEEYSACIEELIRLCNIQESIHDDLMYGVTIKKTNSGLIVSSEPKFFYYSLDRKISLEQLEAFCLTIDKFSGRIKNRIFTEEDLSLELHELNEELLPSSKIISFDKKDYYPGMTEDELLWMLLELEGYPGYLESLVERNKERKLSTNEQEKIHRFNLENGLYLTLLKLEESYFAKREKSLQAKKYML